MTMFQLVLLSPGDNSSNSSNISCDGTAGSADPVGPNALLFKSVFVALGALNLVLNSLSAVIFLCQRKQKGRLIRLLLLLLSFTEVAASFAMSSVEASRIALEIRRNDIVYNSPEAARRLVQFLAVTWALANAALLARNWCVVLIAVSRCEAVVRPFSRNTGRRCGPRTVIAAFVIISVTAAILSAPKAFQELYYLCLSEGQLRIVGRDFQPPFPHYGEFYLGTVFCQAVLPVLIVGVATAAMTLGLRAHQRRSGLASSRAHCKATRMIQLLLGVFVCLEMPMFVTVLLGIMTKNDSSGWDAFMFYAVEVSNLCINLDSTCNFAVYMKTNWAFRSAVLRRSLQTRGPLGYTGGLRGSSYQAGGAATLNSQRANAIRRFNNSRSSSSLMTSEQLRLQRQRQIVLTAGQAKD